MLYRISLVKGLVGSISLLTGILLDVQPYRPVVFVGHSMEPAYPYWSIAITEPVTRPLHRGDVVVVNTSEGTIVKRVSLLPGDRRYRFRVGDDWVDIDPKTLSKHTVKDSKWDIVPAGKLYLLGDNRTVSLDSRVYGYFDEKNVTRVLVSPKPYVPEPYPVAAPSGLVTIALR